MLRALFLPSFALLMIAWAPGGGAQQDAGKPAKPLTMVQVWKMDAVYTDKQHGVSFRYPSVWKPAMQFGYHPPALTYSDAQPIAGFGYSESGFARTTVVGPYTKTNLEGFGIVYAAAPAKSAAECEAKAASMSIKPDAGHVIFGGRSFSVRETGEMGMSQFTSGKLYATYVQSTCYLFETDVAGASPDALDGIPTLTGYRRPIPTAEIDAHLLKIMNSVQITPER